MIGNPSVEGFTRGVSGGRMASRAVDPPDLPGAQAEAEAVGRRACSDWVTQVDAVIGDVRAPATCSPALFQRPWRILHISAHGVFDAAPCATAGTAAACSCPTAC